MPVSCRSNRLVEVGSVRWAAQWVSETIEHQQSKYGWHFTFLGANQDAFAEAGAMGMREGGVANFAMDKVGTAYEMTSRKVSRMRAQKRKGETWMGMGRLVELGC